VLDVVPQTKETHTPKQQEQGAKQTRTGLALSFAEQRTGWRPRQTGRRSRRG
jgi:hypothetical protein